MQKTIQELASLIQGKVIGDINTLVSGVTNADTPKPGFIAFAQDTKTLKTLQDSPIACVIVPEKITESTKPLIQVKEPKFAWAQLLGLFYPKPDFRSGISESAHIAKTAKLGKNITVEPFAYIGGNALIGDGTIIRAHSYISQDVTIGSNCLIHPGVMLYENSVIGNHVIIHAGCVIGTDGFGYVHTPQKQEKVPQVGNVVIEDEVELGACVTIDRATVGSTIIGKGTKIDNLVQIGHNVQIGAHSVLSAQTGISGSCKIGSHVTMGGKVGLGDHVEIGDWTMVGGGSGLATGKKIPARQIIFGQPARPYQEARRQIGAQLRAAETLDEVRALKKKVEELEAKISAGQ